MGTMVMVRRRVAALRSSQYGSARRRTTTAEYRPLSSGIAPLQAITGASPAPERISVSIIAR